MIDEEICEKIDTAGVKSVKVYSVMTCGFQKKEYVLHAYGRDLSRGKIVSRRRSYRNDCSSVNW